MTDPIKHVVVLMFENHSFDQMLGSAKQVYPQLEGVDPQHFGMNVARGQSFFQRPSTDPVVSPDPMHELEHILNSLVNHNSGFVSEYDREYPAATTAQLQRIMDYFPFGSLSALQALAQSFTVCDHWYSSVPGPTWTNRFFVHTATSLGRVVMPGGGDQSPHLYAGYNQDTIYDRLNSAGKTWRIYYGDVPQSLVLEHMREFRNLKGYAGLDGFFDDVQGAEADFPEYVFIEPNYFHVPFERPQNDDHPPHSSLEAQKLLASVYNALRSNAGLWNSTLFVVLYDENGGFYDHVEPPAAVPPDAHTDEYTFDQLGVRVPALLVSPWVDAGVLSTAFDHTSLLKYLENKWGLPALTARDQNAASFGAALQSRTTPRTDTPDSVAIPHVLMAQALTLTADAVPPLNDFQESLSGLSKYLEGGAARVVAAAAAPAVPDPVGRARRARQRVGAYLRRAKP